MPQQTLYPVKSIVDGQRCFEIPITEIGNKVPRGGALKILSPAKYISDRQIKWWKGVLLPALEAYTGNTVIYWENKLKLNVMPIEFKPRAYMYEGEAFAYIPSITILSIKKMNLLMVGSVDHLRDELIYGDKFQWVTLPDSELRKEQVKK